MRPGVHALVSLDGGPLDPSDLDVLGLTAAMRAPHAFGPGFAVAAVDPDPHAVDLLQTPVAVTAFAGFLDEPEELAGALGLPGGSAPALLAAAALERFGAEAPARMVGEWSVLHFDLRARELTLLCSLALRDRLHYARFGNTVAVSPEMLALAGLPGVGRAVDPRGFALEVSRAGLRATRGSGTVWRGVSRVPPGNREVFGPGSQRSIAAAAEPTPALFRGSFEDAVERSNEICRRIVGQQLARYGRTAVLLSGGLDSTLLAAVAAGERGAGAEMFALTSVAPAGSDLPDERALSRSTAAFLGVDQHFVTPAPEVSAYLPSASMIRAIQGPMLGVRHYLSEALNQAAAAAGARAVLDGVQGEMSITCKPALHAEAWWLKRWYRQYLEWKERRTERDASLAGAFHVRLSASLLRSLPTEWAELADRGLSGPQRGHAGKAFGFSPAFRKIATQDTATPEGIRNLMPFRDLRLLRLAASFPGEYFERPGVTRSIARAMLRDRVPEAVRLNTTPRPFSPDYELRLATQAGGALARIPDYRAGDVGEWLDLDWLENALRQTRDHGAQTIQHQVQLTCGAAEFLLMLA